MLSTNIIGVNYNQCNVFNEVATDFNDGLVFLLFSLKFGMSTSYVGKI